MKDNLAIELMEAAVKELQSNQKLISNRERAIVITYLQTALLWAREVK